MGAAATAAGCHSGLGIQLDDNAFNGDEPDSMYSAGAGIFNSGPRTLLQVWNFIAETHPTQTQGWSKLLFVWGRTAGWSEPAIRSLPFFAGMLALALVYRSGHDLFSHQAGLLAVLLLGCSVLFLAKMAHARAFTFVALSTSLILWSYWRLVIHPRPSGHVARAGLLLWQYWPALFALFWLLVPACTRPLSPALRHEESSLATARAGLSALPS